MGSVLNSPHHDVALFNPIFRNFAQVRCELVDVNRLEFFSLCCKLDEVIHQIVLANDKMRAGVAVGSFWIQSRFSSRTVVPHELSNLDLHRLYSGIISLLGLVKSALKLVTHNVVGLR